ncbi:MAG: hypothetical protein WA659_01735 [Candidatus Aquirickettsiella sp.]
MDDDMDFIFNKPNFSSWSISTSLQSLLLREEKWPDYFAIDPTALAPVLNTISEQIKPVNFFNHPPETDLFFRFLRKFVESKPHNDNVLKAFSQITAEILDKLSLESRFDSQQEKVVIHYLNLLALMLEPSYRYLFEKPEISIWTNDFQKISRAPFYSNALLSHFRNTLLLSFQCVPFIKKYPALIQTIIDLAYSWDKAEIGSNELALMKLLDTLGVVDHTLKTSRIWLIKKNQPVIKALIRECYSVLFDQFRPYVDGNFLKYIFYKAYLQQSNKDMPVIALMQLCENRDYQEHCNVHSPLFNTSYDCPPGQFSNLFITLRYNNPKLNSGSACTDMRKVELSFKDGMKKNGINELNYTESQNYLYITDSKKDFLIAKFLFERDDPPETSYTVWATHFPAENQSLSDPLLGSTYTYSMDPSILKHEYIHHLTALFFKNISIDLTLTEGIAELYAEGICSKRQINDLRNFVNDTFIFEFFKARRYPFYFNALKWTGYLTSENPELFKILLNCWQENDLESFYTNINRFTANTSNIDTFVIWSRQHVNTCNRYLSLFPDGHQPPLIYLDDIKACLNQTPTLTTEWPDFEPVVISSLSMFSKKEPANNLSYDDVSLVETTQEQPQAMSRVSSLEHPLVEAKILQEKASTTSIGWSKSVVWGVVGSVAAAGLATLGYFARYLRTRPNVAGPALVAAMIPLMQLPQHAEAIDQLQASGGTRQGGIEGINQAFFKSEAANNGRTLRIEGKQEATHSSFKVAQYGAPLSENISLIKLGLYFFGRHEFVKGMNKAERVNSSCTLSHDRFSPQEMDRILRSLNESEVRYGKK